MGAGTVPREIVLVDTTNLAGPATFSYPDAYGLPLYGATMVSLFIRCFAGAAAPEYLSTTIYGTNDDTVAPFWVNVTPQLCNLGTDTSHASYVGTQVDNNVVQIQGILNVRRILVMVYASNAVNTAEIHGRLWTL